MIKKETLDTIPLSKCVTKSYRLTREGVSVLEELTARISRSAGIEISMAKTLELLIFNARHKPLEELLNIKK